jgi:Trk K+ transport system NAD-binding subunit
MQRAGATAVFTPEHVLAAALAARASAKISPRVSGAQSLGGHLQITEVRLNRGSPLAGKTLAESNLRAETGTTVVGWWRDGQLEPPPGPGVRLELGAILVAAGNDAGIAKLEGLATPMPSSGQMVVVGQDRVAHKVAEFLSDAGEEVRRVSPAPVDGALIGDPLDPDVLERSGVREARAVVLALDTDGETLFAAALVRDLAPEATVVAAARRAENVGRIRRAGADFALSVGQVAGQLLVYQLLGQESVALEAEIQMVRAAAGELAGGKLADARVRQITGCTVVAVERADDVIAGVSGDFRVRAGDVLYITGASTDVDRFFDSFPGTRPTRADA